MPERRGTGTCEGEGIYYRTDRSGTWEQRRLTSLQMDRATSLVTDASGAPHLLYQRPYLIQGQEHLGTGLFHMTDRYGRWTKEKVIEDGRNARLAIDGRGRVHAIYNQDAEGRHGIYFSTNEDGALSNSTRIWKHRTAVKERAIYQEMGII